MESERPLDKVEADRKRIVDLINAKYNTKVEKPVVVVKTWTKEKLDDSDIKVEKSEKGKKNPKIEKTKIQTELF
jgi:hypothetical protein